MFIVFFTLENKILRDRFIFSTAMCSEIEIVPHTYNVGAQKNICAGTE